MGRDQARTGATVSHTAYLLSFSTQLDSYIGHLCSIIILVFNLFALIPARVGHDGVDVVEDNGGHVGRLLCLEG